RCKHIMTLGANTLRDELPDPSALIGAVYEYKTGHDLTPVCRHRRNSGSSRLLQSARHVDCNSAEEVDMRGGGETDDVRLVRGSGSKWMCRPKSSAFLTFRFGPIQLLASGMRRLK